VYGDIKLQICLAMCRKLINTDLTRLYFSTLYRWWTVDDADFDLILGTKNKNTEVYESPDIEN
jgi:hypothetical protein